MASSLKNLSLTEGSLIPDASKMTFGIVVSEWNSEITGTLLEGTETTLQKHGALPQNIAVKTIPGSFELTLGAQWLAEHGNVDAIICLGCVIQGETRHFEFICQAVSQGLTNLSIKYGKPFIFGVLTTDTLDQARARAGGKHGNKGIEAAVTAIKMVALQQKLIKNQ